MHRGQDFIRHEFDEAIAVQQAIVRGAGELSRVHPLPDGKKQLKTVARESEQWLKKLQKSGQKFGATGKKEEVATGIDQLAQTTMQAARQGEPSEVYEAQAVVINAIRKQQDSAGSIIKIARSLKDRDMATEAREMQRASKRAADDLAKNLTELAVVIAMQGQDGQRATSGRRPSGARAASGARTASGSRSGTSARSTASSRSASRSSTSRRTGSARQRSS